MKRVSGALLVMLVLALGTSAFAADPVFPDLQFVNFDQASYTYTYRVTCPADSTFPFGRLAILAEVPNAGIYFPWGHGADTNPTNRWVFYTQDRDFDSNWEPITSNAVWKAAVLEDVIPANTAWTGQFTLTVPFSRLVQGVGITMDGGDWSMQSHTVYVPGPALVPEPGSLLALGGLVGGMLPLIRRRRR